MNSQEKYDEVRKKSFQEENHFVDYGTSTVDNKTENFESGTPHTKMSTIIPHIKSSQKSWQLFSPDFRFELKSLLYIAVPMMCTNLLQYTIIIISNIMCGHLSTVEFDAASLANSMINAFGLSIGTGLCTASDTFIAQIYGSSNKKGVGVVLQKGALINSLAPLILWIFHLNAEPIFLLLQQDPEVSRLASTFMRFFMPALLFQFNYLLLARYLQNQNRVMVPLVVGILGNVFNILSQYVSIYVLGFGIRSSAICQAGSFFVMFIAILAYIIGTKFYKETWRGWSWEAFFDWDNFLALAIPGIILVSVEVIVYEVCTFISGVMGLTQLGAQSIIYQTDTVAYTFGIGVGIATNIRVGQYLGANNPQAAKLVLRVGLFITGILATLFAIVYVGAKDVYPKIFTNDLEVIELASGILPILPIVTIGDNLLAVLTGALRGCGRHKLGAIIVIITYNFIGLPIGLVLAFVANWELMGLWIGIATGVVLCVLILGYVILRQDWEVQAELAQSRLEKCDYSRTHEPATENTHLLNKFEEGDLGRILTGHVRTPSQPYGCSIDIPIMPPKRAFISHHQLVSVLRRRAIVVSILVLLFAASVVFFQLFPTDIIVPNNSTMINNNTFNQSNILQIGLK